MFYVPVLIVNGLCASILTLENVLLSNPCKSRQGRMGETKIYRATQRYVCKGTKKTEIPSLVTL